MRAEIAALRVTCPATPEPLLVNQLLPSVQTAVAAAGSAAPDAALPALPAVSAACAVVRKLLDWEFFQMSGQVPD